MRRSPRYAKRVMASLRSLLCMTTGSGATRGQLLIGDHLSDAFAHDGIDLRGRPIWAIDPHSQKYLHRAGQVLLPERLKHRGKAGANPRVAKLIPAQSRRNEDELLRHLGVGDREFEGGRIIGETNQRNLLEPERL